MNFALPPMLAIIELTFDPFLRLGELSIRWQTIGVTIALLAALSVAALMAPDISGQRPFFRRRPSDIRVDRRPRFPAAPLIDTTGEVSSTGALRLDDMVLILAGIVPGAVIGGRLTHALVFWDAYAAGPLKIFDPSIGTLSLAGVVLGGLISGAYVARVVGAPVRRWMDAAAVPLLLAIGLGKAAQFLGGSGQGMPFDGPWAVAFSGGGPWVSTNPQLPSHPAQIYEALWALIGIPLVLRLAGPRRQPVRVNRLVAWADRWADQGRLFLGALSWFLIGRLLIGFTWRDETTLGPLNSEQVVALAMLVTVQLGFRARSRRRGLRSIVSTKNEDGRTKTGAPNHDRDRRTTD